MLTSLTMSEKRRRAMSQNASFINISEEVDHIEGSAISILSSSGMKFAEIYDLTSNSDDHSCRLRFNTGECHRDNELPPRISKCQSTKRNVEIIDLVNDPIHDDRKAKLSQLGDSPKSRKEFITSENTHDSTDASLSQNLKRARLSNGEINPKDGFNLLSKQSDVFEDVYKRSPNGRHDSAIVSFNLLDLIQRLLNENTLTVHGKQSCSHRSYLKKNEPIFNRQPLHYTQNDKWSCGFRNLQMMISAMLPTLCSIFPNGVPIISELQHTFQLLWAEGFDRDGAKHHKSKLAGKTSWIGTVEVWSYLAFYGIDATIVQFINTKESRSKIGPFVWAYFSRLAGPAECKCQNVNVLMTSHQYVQDLLHVVQQFNSDSDDSNVQLSCDCTLLPLYLQWSGHSVTIVGIRKERDNKKSTVSYHLILFDPQKNGEVTKAKLTAVLESSIQPRRPNCISFMELPTRNLLGKDSQILLPTTRIMLPNEREKCRHKVSCITALR